MKAVRIAIFAAIILFAFAEANVAGSVKYAPAYSPDFWVKQQKNPDEIILSADQIEDFNRGMLYDNDDMADLETMSNTVFRQDVIVWMLEDPLPVEKKMFNRKGKPLDESFYKKIHENMDVGEVKETSEAAFGIIIKRTDIRAFPTDEPVLKRPAAQEFDSFQYSSIYPPQVVALLHKSRDCKWGYFQTNFVRGWIKLDDVAFAGSRDEAFISYDKTIVVTGSKISIFADKRHTKQIGSVPMGTALSLKSGDSGNPVVHYPGKDANGMLKWIDGYIDKKADINAGPLPYTKRNVINQAFKMMGEKYGWGGANGLRDCSSFIKDIFATMGIVLPRNSARQAAVGHVMAERLEGASSEEINDALAAAVPGASFLALNGHIMLFLGSLNGSYYAIHQIFGYYEKDGFNTVNKVVVTNLDLGKGSKTGAIKDRVRCVTVISNQKNHD